MTDRVWTMPDIAAHLGVPEGTVRQWRNRGHLPEPSGVTVRSPWWVGEQIEAWLHQWLIDHEPQDGSGSDPDW